MTEFVITTAEQWIEARESTERDRYFTAAWCELPVDIWRRILELRPDMAKWVAHAKSTPMEILGLLAGHPDHQVRGMVAMRRKAGPLLVRLAQDPDPGVRRTVAFNPKTPDAILVQLTQDTDSLVSQPATEKLARRRR